MNFLAHILLSGNNKEILVGNFIGDFVKGGHLENYSKSIQKGILLHREIDRFTDTHEIVKESKVRLRKKYRHYAPVIVDLYYDHFLAKNWNTYSKIDLEEYTLNFYKLILSFKEILPKEVNHMLNYMIKDNWLLAYKEIEGIELALKGMARRTKFDSKMDEAASTLKKHYVEFEGEFNRFFPILINHVNRKL